MSDAPAPSKESSVRRQRSIFQVHYSMQRQELTRPMEWPAQVYVQQYGRQVAGHTNEGDCKYLGLLQRSDGTILKPLIKESQRREVDFYRRVTTSSHPDLQELRRSIPQYFGTTTYTYRGFTQEYIVLEDLCQRMLEPCIMDVKIGKRTWDPLASEEKIKKEQSKYKLCKQEYGFCIPGFQVYRVDSGQLCRYNKDYGKKLHSQAVVDAIRKYLNGAGGVCRALLLQLLAALWRIQRWARSQTRVRVYCASLLLIYDAAKLRDYQESSQSECSRPRPPRRRSIHSLHSVEGSPFSGQLSHKGPVYKKVESVPLSSLSLARSPQAPPPSAWSLTLERLNQNHSFDHNYEDKVSKIKMNYRALLDQLTDESPNPKPWATVKIIDFAHVFFNEEEEEMGVDENFKEGVDNFVKILECFLRETDDQVI